MARFYQAKQCLALEIITDLVASGKTVKDADDNTVVLEGGTHSSFDSANSLERNRKTWTLKFHDESKAEITKFTWWHRQDGGTYYS